MELVSQYLKRKDRWLNAFLGERKLPEYQRKLLEAMQNRPDAGSPYFRLAHLGRQSGKTDMQMEFMEQVLFGHQHVEPPRPRQIRISDEMIQDGQWDVVSSLTREAGRRMAQQMEQSAFNSIMESLLSPNDVRDSLGTSRILFQNGSEIAPMEPQDPLEVIRGRLSRRDFQQEYLCDWGDSDGDNRQ